MNKSIIDQICDKVPFEDILNSFNLQKYELIRIYEKLLSRKDLPTDIYSIIKKSYLDNCIYFSVYGEKIVIISDTHLGSIQENMEYLEQIKYFVNKKNISILLHGGDIGDGLLNYSKKYSTNEKQIRHIRDDYLHFDNTTQYILGGNHDKRYRKRGNDILKVLSEDDSKVIPLGYYKALFKIYNKVASFEHNSHIHIQNITEDIRLLGHSHICKFNDKKIHIPASCDENTNNYSNFVPGFITMQARNIGYAIELKFIQYEYTNNGPQYVSKRKYILDEGKQKIKHCPKAITKVKC